MSLAIEDLSQERLGLPELAASTPAPYPLVLVNFGEKIDAFAERFELSRSTAAALALRACGLSHAEIATELDISEGQAKELVLAGLRTCVESSKRL